jgi:hypothetical protein
LAAETRSEQFAEAIGHVRGWNTPEAALRAVGINPTSISGAEQAQLAEAEREAIDEAIGHIREAAKTDPAAARWLRSRGLSVE